MQMPLIAIQDLARGCKRTFAPLIVRLLLKSFHRHCWNYMLVQAMRNALSHLFSVEGWLFGCASFKWCMFKSRWMSTAFLSKFSANFQHDVATHQLLRCGFPLASFKPNAHPWGSATTRECFLQKAVGHQFRNFPTVATFWPLICAMATIFQDGFGAPHVVSPLSLEQLSKLFTMLLLVESLPSWPRVTRERTENVCTWEMFYYLNERIYFGVVCHVANVCWQPEMVDSSSVHIYLSKWWTFWTTKFKTCWVLWPLFPSFRWFTLIHISSDFSQKLGCFMLVLCFGGQSCKHGFELSWLIQSWIVRNVGLHGKELGFVCVDRLLWIKPSATNPASLTDPLVWSFLPSVFMSWFMVSTMPFGYPFCENIIGTKWTYNRFLGRIRTLFHAFLSLSKLQ